MDTIIELWSIRTQRTIIEHRFVSAQLYPEPMRSKVRGECLEQLKANNESMHKLYVRERRQYNRLLVMSGIVYVTAAVAFMAIAFTILFHS